jgi:hypothetical protein
MGFRVRSALFWDITQCRVVILYRRFGTTYPSHLKGSGSPRRKKRIQKYHSTLSNYLPEECKSHLHRDGILKSRMVSGWHLGSHRSGQYRRTRLQRHHFMRHLACNVRYSVVPINSSLLTVTL